MSPEARGSVIAGLNPASPGLINAAMQLARVWAFQKGPATILAPLYFLTVPFSGLLDWIFWDHVPGGLFYVGAVLIVGGGIWVIEMGRKRLREGDMDDNRTKR